MNNLTNINILIVEDDADMRDILTDLIRENGATVFQAADGKEALQIIESETIHLVISDVLMPVMGGIDLVKAIRAKNLDIPVVLLVTGQSDLNEQSALVLGAAGLVHKPYNIGVLLQRISECLTKIKIT